MIERASLLIRESEKAIIIRIDNNFELNITAIDLKEDIDIVQEGKDIVIGFNPKFLLDALRVIDDEMVDIYLINPMLALFGKDQTIPNPPVNIHA